MVDWSANNTPKFGADSIWYCLAERVEGMLRVGKPVNPSTRAAAIQQIKTVLSNLAGRGLSTLAGFDFPYGYPAGFARALGLPCVAPWKEVWDLLRTEIKDDNRNRSNRFEVAADLNRRISDGSFPFWGCPNTQQGPHLTMKRGRRHEPVDFAEFREVDKWQAGMQPIWKLCYPGSVGSQALVGIPYIAALRFGDSALSAASRVWPLETGFKLEPRAVRSWSILHAEIYPSILKNAPAVTECKDEVQVRRLAEHFARLDEEGSLWRLFELPSGLSEASVHAAQSEESWTLGVR